MQNSIHATEEYHLSGGEQGVRELVQRCVEMAETQGLSEADLEAEVGDLYDHVRKRVELVNKIENERTDRHRP